MVGAPHARLQNTCRALYCVSLPTHISSQLESLLTLGLFELDSDCIPRRSLLVSDRLNLEGKLEAGVPGASNVDLLGAVFALDRRPDVLLLAKDASRCLSIRWEVGECFDRRDDGGRAELEFPVPDGAEQVHVTV